MPVAPTAPVGTGSKLIVPVQVDPVAITASFTSEGIIVPRTGYLTACRYIPVAAMTGAASPASRTHNIVDPTTRVVTDAIVALNTGTVNKGPWLAATAYSTGDVVTYNNFSYVAIASTTGDIPGQSATKWTQVNAFGLTAVTSLTALFTQDDVGKTISGTGYTSATITSVQDAQTALVTANSTIRNALSLTIGASRTLATLAYVSGVNLVQDVPKTIVLSTTDTKVYAGDVLQVQSTAVTSGTGLADPGGIMQLELTAYGEGSD